MNRPTAIAIFLGLVLLTGLMVRNRTGSRDEPGGGGSDSESPARYSPWVTVPPSDRRPRRRGMDRADMLSSGPLPHPVARPAAGALPGERTLIFASESDYRAFLRAMTEDDADTDPGLRLLGSLDAFAAVRVGEVESDEQLARLFDQLGIDPPQAGANFAVATPRMPVREARDPLNPEPFGNLAAEWLDLDGFDLSNWGEGVRIAVLDGGIAPIFNGREIPNTPVHDSAPAPEGLPAMHGTAVSSIMVSEDPRIPGIAPAAELLGFSVMDENGLSDSFTLASGIVAAVDGGADLINASLGSAGDSPVVREAVRYAEDHGVLIIASAGNEQLSEVAFPARYPETIAVGAIDARGRQLTFSNSGEALGIGAPGQEIYAFGANGSPVSFSGTSASAPFVTAAVAAVMSQEPNLSARQAADLLFAHANEAGAPGFDPHYGFGNLNIARVMNRNEAGRRDVAVADHYVTRDAEGRPVVQVIVENRGTVAAPGPRLEVELDGGARVAVLPPIQPNEIFARDFPLIPGRMIPGEPFPVQSEVTWTGDLDAGNNALSTDISRQFSE